jgi:hypothetical protein
MVGLISFDNARRRQRKIFDNRSALSRWLGGDAADAAQRAYDNLQVAFDEAGAAHSSPYLHDIDSFVRGAADTMAFGFADEGAALADSAVDAVSGNPVDYDRRLRQQRTRQQIRDELDPIASNSGRLAGGLVGGWGLYKGGLTLAGNSLPWLSRIMPRTTQAALASLDGGLNGAVYGFGSGQGMDDRLSHMRRDAVAGALTGLALGTIGEFLPVAAKTAQQQLARHESVEISQRAKDVLNDPTLRKKMVDLIRLGLQMGAENWFNTEPLRRLFMQRLGRTEGNRAYKEFVASFAAATPGSEVGISVRNGSAYYKAIRREEPTPTKTPYGHYMQGLHMDNVEQFRRLGKFISEVRRKTASMYENSIGNLVQVTVDVHLFRLAAMLAGDARFLKTNYRGRNIRQMVQSGQMSMSDALKRPAYWEGVPKEGEYIAFERWIQDIAREQGIHPAHAQVAAWMAGGKMTGLRSNAFPSLMGFIEDRVRRTATKLKISEREVWRRVIDGKETLHSLAGVGVGTGVAAGMISPSVAPKQDQPSTGGPGHAKTREDESHHPLELTVHPRRRAINR